jgi:hypothetical protein
MSDFFWFSDGQWARIAPLLPVNGKGARALMTAAFCSYGASYGDRVPVTVTGATNPKLTSPSPCPPPFAARR